MHNAVQLITDPGLKCCDLSPVETIYFLLEIVNWIQIFILVNNALIVTELLSI